VQKYQVPEVVAAAQLTLKLTKDFVPGFYSLGLASCSEQMNNTCGMFFVAQDKHADLVFRHTILKQHGDDWMWTNADQGIDTADPHGFTSLKERIVDRRTKEKVKDFDWTSRVYSHFGNVCIAIGVPIGIVGSPFPASLDAINNEMDKNQANLKLATASQAHDESRIHAGHIAAIGLSVETHDGLPLNCYTADQCCVCNNTVTGQKLFAVAACGHACVCDGVENCLKLMQNAFAPCPLCRAVNMLKVPPSGGGSA